MLATNATAAPVLLGEGAEVVPVGVPPLPPTEGLLLVAAADTLVLDADSVGLLNVVLRAMLRPVPEELAAVPTATVVVALAVAVAKTVEFAETDELLLPPPTTPPEEPLVVEPDADAEEDAEDAVDEPAAEEAEPPVTVIMPV